MPQLMNPLEPAVLRLVEAAEELLDNLADAEEDRDDRGHTYKDIKRLKTALRAVKYGATIH